MKRLALLLCLFVLPACTGVDGETYMGRPGSPAWFATAHPATIAAYFRAQCEAYGFKPGTDALAQCIENESQNKRNANATRALAIAQMSQSMQPVPTPRPINCTATRMGSMVNATCY